VRRQPVVYVFVILMQFFPTNGSQCLTSTQAMDRHGPAEHDACRSLITEWCHHIAVRLGCTWFDDMKILLMCMPAFLNDLSAVQSGIFDTPSMNACGVFRCMLRAARTVQYFLFRLPR